jgi:histidinol dehydrogenase
VIRPFRIPSREAERHLEKLARRTRALFDGEAARVAARALEDIRRGGDRALERWRKRFDGVSGPERGKSRTGCPAARFRRAFEESLRRLTAFHSRQKPAPARWRSGGSLLEERVVALDSVAVYVPGGEAVYVSSALMAIVPARLAGVRRIAVATPPAAWDSCAELRWALGRLGVREIYRMGGAHAIVALAVGTETIAPVAKIVGPGNAFVMAAKRLVSGLVGIEGIAGPTEVAIFADGAADAELVAADLLAQAEHDVDAAAVLVTTSERLGKAVAEAIARQLTALPTRRRAAEALRRHGAIGIARSRAEAVAFLEALAPEHLGVQTARSLADAGRFTRAGAIFAGPATSEVFGDYVAGSNHVLPTNGTARFASALSVRDFVRHVPVVSLSAETARRLAPHAEAWAAVEGLPAHAAAARLRRTREGVGSPESRVRGGRT